MRDTAREISCRTSVGSPGALLLAAFVAVLLSMLPQRADADPYRHYSLFPETLVTFRTQPSPTRAAVLLTQSQILLGETNCQFVFPHVPLIYTTLQIGAGCAISTGKSNAVSFDLLVEGAFRQAASRKGVRPGGLAKLHETFVLARAEDGSSVQASASLALKIIPTESRRAQIEYSRPFYNPFYIQRWADVLESNYTLGVTLLRAFQDRPEGMAWRAQYLETAPLALRRWGGISRSASIQYKELGVSARFNFSGFVAGGGLGYAVLTFDGVRVGLFLPSVTFGFLI